MTRWALAHGRHLDLGGTARLMGIVNVTPDSFSGDGLSDDTELAVAQALAMAGQGADIIDIGGESTRPDADPVTAEAEQARILPVFAGLSAHPGLILSVDTWRAETARLAVAKGAHVINDVHGLQRDAAMADVAAETGAGLVIMHTGRGRDKLADVIDDQFAFLGRSLEIARAAGVSGSQIVLDPGFGFAKDADENIALMARFSELSKLGFPLLAGVSRKRFLGAVSGRPPQERDAVTAAASAVLRLAGAAVFRVHDVAINSDALRLADAMLAAGPRAVHL